MGRELGNLSKLKLAVKCELQLQWKSWYQNNLLFQTMYFTIDGGVWEISTGIFIHICLCFLLKVGILVCNTQNHCGTVTCLLVNQIMPVNSEYYFIAIHYQTKKPLEKSGSPSWHFWRFSTFSIVEKVLIWQVLPYNTKKTTFLELSNFSSEDCNSLVDNCF